MKLIVAIRLLPKPEQVEALRLTLERCNAACDWLAGLAHESGARRLGRKA